MTDRIYKVYLRASEFEVHGKCHTYENPRIADIFDGNIVFIEMQDGTQVTYPKDVVLYVNSAKVYRK